MSNKDKERINDNQVEENEKEIKEIKKSIKDTDKINENEIKKDNENKSKIKKTSNNSEKEESLEAFLSDKKEIKDEKQKIDDAKDNEKQSVNIEVKKTNDKNDKLKDLKSLLKDDKIDKNDESDKKQDSNKNSNALKKEKGTKEKDKAENKSKVTKSNNTAKGTKKRKNFFLEFFNAYQKTKQKQKLEKKEAKVLKKKKYEGENKKYNIFLDETYNFKRYFNKDTFLFSTFIIFVLFAFVSIVLPQDKEISSLVKSNLTDTELIEEGYLKWEKELENTIITKFPFYEEILRGYFGTIQLSNKKLYENANDNDLILLDSKNGIYIDKYQDQLIRKYEVEEENQDEELKRRAKLFNVTNDILSSNNINMYIYAVSGIWTSEAILNFELDYKEPLKYVNLFKDSINPNIKFDYLKIIDYKTFKEYFFATDHHWRMQGAYQGYKDVMKMFGMLEDEIIPPNFFKVEGVEFIGSNARVCAFDNVIDYLYDIDFDEEYEVEVNGKKISKEKLSKRSKYLEGDFSDEEFYNHYGSYFHSDLGEIIYTYDKNKVDIEETASGNDKNSNEEKRVLIISDSYSNCIDRLIASHFYKTYVVDLRYYENSLRKEFNLEEYVKENEITDVVVMLSANSIYFESSELDFGIDEELLEISDEE